MVVSDRIKVRRSCNIATHGDPSVPQIVILTEQFEPTLTIAKSLNYIVNFFGLSSTSELGFLGRYDHV